MVTVEPATQELGGERKETGQTHQAAGQERNTRAPQRNGMAAPLKLTEPRIEGILPFTDHGESLTLSLPPFLPPSLKHKLTVLMEIIPS